MSGQGAQGIDLLSHTHGSNLGGEGGPDAPRNHQPGQDRTQLAAH